MHDNDNITNDTPIHDGITPSPDVTTQADPDAADNVVAPVEADFGTDYADRDVTFDGPDAVDEKGEGSPFATRDGGGYHVVWGTENDGPYVRNFENADFADEFAASHDGARRFDGTV